MRAVEHAVAGVSVNCALSLKKPRNPEYTRSALEERFRDFCRDHCVPRPEVNAWVLGFEVDALWRAERVIVELDGWEYHRSRAAFERDRAKAAKLEVAGFLVYRLTHRRLEREPLAVAEDLLRALSNRANP